MKPTLFVLAAGMGSRYGGLKQLDGLGPNGETIMDYSIFDAIRGGFGKVVFVIRKGFRSGFPHEDPLQIRKPHPPSRWSSSRSTTCPRASSTPKDAPSHGVRTTPC